MTYRLLRLELEQNFNGIIAYKTKKVNACVSLKQVFELRIAYGERSTMRKMKNIRHERLICGGS